VCGCHQVLRSADPLLTQDVFALALSEQRDDFGEPTAAANALTRLALLLASYDMSTADLEPILAVLRGGHGGATTSAATSPRLHGGRLERMRLLRRLARVEVLRCSPRAYVDLRGPAAAVRISGLSWPLSGCTIR
jgi:hypothetical protein